MLQKEMTLKKIIGKQTTYLKIKLISKTFSVIIFRLGLIKKRSNLKILNEFD